MATTIQHYQDLGDFNYGASDQVSPLIRRVICKNTPFTYKGTGTYLVGQGEVAVIDPGPPLESHLDDILSALEPDEVVTHAFITHTHSDHSPLTAQLKEKDGSNFLRLRAAWSGPGRRPRGPSRLFCIHLRTRARAVQKKYDELPEELKKEGADTEFSPDVFLSDGDIISGANWTIRSIHTPGHCSNHLLLRTSRRSLLIFRRSRDGMGNQRRRTPPMGR